MERLQKPAYQMTIEQLMEALSVTADGLSSKDAAQRLHTYGLNQLAEKQTSHPIVIFLSQFSNPLVILLLISSGISFLLSEHIDAVFIFAIVFINALVGFIQEYKAENTIRALKKLLSPKALVIREGKYTEIDSIKLVPGDIISVTAGNTIPADIRLLEIQNLRVDESTLTGESVPVEKKTHVITEEAQVSDQHNIAFMGTTVIGGKAEGIVINTGNTTFLGTIAKETSETKQEASPLIRKFSQFAQTIGVIVIVASVFIIATLLSRGESFASIMKAVVGIAVATIPEGLPIVATIALSLTVQRMGRKKAIIRHLPAAETLGSTTVICTDKTGTLTMNQMTVMKLFDGKQEYTAHAQHDHTNKHLSRLLHCGVLCTETPEVHTNHSLTEQGDPTEMAIISTSRKSGIPLHEIQEWKYLDVLPFQTESRLMAALVEKNSEKVLYTKGSPETILKLCNQQNDEELLQKIQTYAQNGLRIIACAEKKLETGHTITEEHLHSGFTFLGFFALIDPPRPDIKDAIAQCRKSGIRVIMITGDHPVTAAAIATQLGIADEIAAKTGKDILHMSDDELHSVLKQTSVFARVTPDQKLRIVNLLKEMGEIVAVTGDGVNDAPALRSAHIGIAMGKRGTDVAKEASHMVILDDNFSTIVKAVREARVLFENIRKATIFLIPTGFSVILTVFVSLLMGYPMPFTALQLLWVNMVTNGLQDVSLAFEPEEKGLMSKPPRRSTEGIMSPLMYRRSILVAVVITIGVMVMFVRAMETGASIEEARTIALSTMIIFQFMHLFNSRSETISIFKQHLFTNKLLIVAMLLAVGAFILTLTYPPLQWLLSTTSIDISRLFQIILMAFTVIFVVEIDKVFTRIQYKN